MDSILNEVDSSIKNIKAKKDPQSFISGRKEKFISNKKVSSMVSNHPVRGSKYANLPKALDRLNISGEFKVNII